MPNERMADDDHPVLFTEFDVAIGGGKIVDRPARDEPIPT